MRGEGLKRNDYDELKEHAENITLLEEQLAKTGTIIPVIYPHRGLSKILRSFCGKKSWGGEVQDALGVWGGGGGQIQFEFWGLS